MIKIENVEVFGWEAAIRGMRNPMNSWDKSDTEYEGAYGVIHTVKLGDADCELAMKLVDGGPVHAKFRRMINVTLDITAPLYWWKEFDTYKVGTARNSCSTMHTIHSKPFELDDFSYEHLLTVQDKNSELVTYVKRELLAVPLGALTFIIDMLNLARKAFIDSGDKQYWWQMIQLLPSSYNQRSTVQLNYETLANIYKWRKDHKLDEWREFCKWIKTLPYSELITGE